MYSFIHSMAIFKVQKTKFLLGTVLQRWPLSSRTQSVGGHAINTRIHSPLLKYHGGIDTKCHRNSVGNFLHIYPHLPITNWLYLWQGWMPLVYAIPVIFQELQENAGPWLPLSGAGQGKHVFRGRKRAELRAGLQLASCSGGALPTAPLPWAGGWTSKGGWGREVSYFREDSKTSQY